MEPPIAPGEPAVVWDESPRKPRVSGRRRLVAVVVGLGILLVVAAVLNFKLVLFVQTERDYAVGECSNRANGPNPQAPLVLVSCDQPHLFEIIATFPLPPGITSFEEVDRIGASTCLAAFRREVGSEYLSQSELAMKYLTRTEADLRQRPTTAACAVYRPDESPLTRSVRVRAP
jgi:hypothetical protein